VTFPLTPQDTANIITTSLRLLDKQQSSHLHTVAVYQTATMSDSDEDLLLHVPPSPGSESSVSDDFKSMDRRKFPGDQVFLQSPELPFLASPESEPDLQLKRGRLPSPTQPIPTREPIVKPTPRIRKNDETRWPDGVVSGGVITDFSV
jgi:hypothetical protein